ncbi:FAD-binding protein [Sphingomonas sp. KR3-1]|uniref:FAD-dependent oxidoreductase n=1 Tax=Sphingomonas sp. KR3-1 TaxID=3156611 RepID=UPI0032B5BD3C
MSDFPTRSGDAVMTSDRQGFDRRWYAPNLAAVYVPASLDDVAPCVQAALAAYGADVKIVSGRHCYEDFAYNDTTRAVIDMSALNQVGLDPQLGYFVDAGSENWTVYRTLLNGFGKTLPAGSCYSVGAGGHITGGGYGLLSRLHGLTVDWLTGVDIVTWDAGSGTATLRHVSAASSDPAEQDLFWALCGAGCGNFGVIVRYYFATLPDAPDHASLWTLAWNWSDVPESAFTALLALYAKVVSDMPETDFSLLKLNHVAAGQIGLIYQSVSPPGTSKAAHRARAAAQAEQLKRRLREVAPSSPLIRPLGGHPGLMTSMLASEDIQHLTYLEALQTLNGSGPNQFGKYKSAYMKAAFPPAQASTIYQWLNTVPPGLDASDMAQSLLQVDSYGGAINTVDPTATAVPQRSSIMKLQYQTYWNNASPPGGPLSPADEAQAQAHLAWIDEFYAFVYAATGGVPDPALDPDGVVDGCYFNYPDLSLGSYATGNVDQALRLYFLDNFRANPRNLVAIKQQWDPQDFFHHQQSLPVT